MTSTLKETFSRLIEAHQRTKENLPDKSPKLIFGAMAKKSDGDYEPLFFRANDDSPLTFYKAGQKAQDEYKDALFYFIIQDNQKDEIVFIGCFNKPDDPSKTGVMLYKVNYINAHDKIVFINKKLNENDQEQLENDPAFSAFIESIN